MKKAEIRVGGLYLAKVGGRVTTVRVDDIRQVPTRSGYQAVYDVTNPSTGRMFRFTSAAKFLTLAEK